MRPAVLSILLALSGCALDSARAKPEVHRSAAARAAFVRTHPCPETGQTRGACPGWVVDHIEPLCAGGADDPANMQWQTVEAAKIKDREERAKCRALRPAYPGR